MTDNGLAALAEALVRADYLSPNGYPATDSFAAAILGPRGVFLPEGLPEIVENMEDAYHEALALRGATIAALRAALDGLVYFAWHEPTCGFLRSSTVSHRVICNCGLTAALAAKETP